MARVEIAAQGWGWLADRNGNAQAARPVTIDNLDDTDATVFVDVTGDPELTMPLTTDADGLIPGFIDPGTYILTAGGETKRVEAVSGIASGGGIEEEEDPIAGPALTAHEADTSVHGITDTADLVLTDDARLSDARAPTAHTHDDRYYTEAEVTALLAVEAWHVVGSGGGEPAFAGSWANTGTGASLAFRKGNGIVRFRGLITGGTGLIFTLPVGYRPAAFSILVAQSAGTVCRIYVDVTGTVTLVGGNSTALTMEGLTFDVT